MTSLSDMAKTPKAGSTSNSTKNTKSRGGVSLSQMASTPKGQAKFTPTANSPKFMQSKVNVGNAFNVPKYVNQPVLAMKPGPRQEYVTQYPNMSLPQIAKAREVATKTDTVKSQKPFLTQLIEGLNPANLLKGRDVSMGTAQQGLFGAGTSGNKALTREWLKELSDIQAEQVAMAYTGKTGLKAISKQEAKDLIGTALKRDIPKSKPIVEPPQTPKIALGEAKPMEVSKTLNPLAQEASKYKSAEEFVKGQGTPVYHGTDSKFDVFKKPLGEPGSEGIFVSESRDNANYYKRTDTGEIKEVYLKNGAKIWDYKNPQDVKALQQKIIEYVPENKNKVEWTKLNAENDKIVNRGIYQNNSLQIRPEDLKRYNQLREKLDNFPDVGGTSDRNLLANKIPNAWYTDLSEALKNPKIKKWFEQNYDGWKQLDHTDYGVDVSIGVFSPESLKTKSQLTDIWNKSQPLQEGGSLIQEARKYKSAEEFVKAQTPSVGKVKTGVQELRIKDLYSHAKDELQDATRAVESGALSKSTGPIEVTQLSNGKIVVMDGQHRVIQAISGGKQTIKANVIPYKDAINPEFGFPPRVFIEGSAKDFEGTPFQTKSQLTDIWNKAKTEANGASLDKTISQLSAKKSPLQPKKTVTNIERPEKAIDVFRSVESRMERSSSQGKKIVSLFKESDTQFLPNMGKKALALADTKIGKLKNPTRVTDALEGRIKPSDLKPDERKVFNVVNYIRKSVAERSKKTGLEIRTSGGGKVPFKARENYYPHYIPEASKLEKGKIRTEVLKSAVERKDFKSLEEATSALDKWIAFQKSGGKDNLDFFANRLVDEQAKKGRTVNLEQARGSVLRYFRASRQQRYGNLERAREIDLPFYDPNPARVIPQYIASTERRLADAAVLGPNLEKVDQLLGTVKHPDVQKTLRNLVKVARRANEPGEQLAGKALDVTRGLSTFRLGPLSGITNLGQSTNSYLASDAKSFTKGFVKAIFTKEGRRLPMKSGNLAESVLRTIQQQAGGDSRIASTYLKASGFTTTEQINRRIASNTGSEYLKGLYKKLIKNPADKTVRAEITDLEINPDDLLKKGLVRDTLLRAAKVFTDKTQFRSREIDLPSITTTTALGKNISQFKTFAFQQSRFIAKQTVDQLKTNPRRALRNIAVLATVYPLVGEAIADLRAMIQGKERTTRGIQRYIEDAAQVGAFGILYDAVKSLSFEGGLVKFLAGPTISGITDNIETTKQAFDKYFSDAEKRDYIRQIPGVGPIIANRLLPAEERNDNKNLGAGKDIVKDTGFGETTIPKPEFRIDGQNIGLKLSAAKEYQAEIVSAYTESLKEASELPGWKDKDNAAKKKEFDKIFNKKKTATKESWIESGKLNPDTVAGENRLTEGSGNIFTVASNYARGIVIDPENTLRAFFTEERLRDVVGSITKPGSGVVRLERKKFLSLLDKGDKNTVIDHIIPVGSLGGDNSNENLRAVDEEFNKKKGQEEARLLELIRNGILTKQQAIAALKKWEESNPPKVNIKL